MGYTKRMFEQMQLESLICDNYEINTFDDEYQYEQYRIQQLEAEQLAYEECLADKY